MRARMPPFSNSPLKPRLHYVTIIVTNAGEFLSNIIEEANILLLHYYMPIEYIRLALAVIWLILLARHCCNINAVTPK